MMAKLDKACKEKKGRKDINKAYQSILFALKGDLMFFFQKTMCKREKQLATMMKMTVDITARIAILQNDWTKYLG